MVVAHPEGGSSDDDGEVSTTSLLEDPYGDSQDTTTSEDSGEDYEYTGDFTNENFDDTVYTGEDDTIRIDGQTFDSPEEAFGHYLEDPELNDGEGPSVTPLRDAQDAANEVIETTTNINVDDILPDWMPAAVAGVGVLAFLFLLRPYASLASGVAS